MDKIKELLEGFHCPVELPVQWGDMDAFQHVNNVQYVRYMESGRIAYGEELGFWKTIDATGIGPILKDLQIRYKFPVTFPDHLISCCRVLEIGETEMTIEHRIISRKHQRIAAEGVGTVVAYDFKQLAKTQVPTLWVEQAEAKEGRHLGPGSKA